MDNSETDKTIAYQQRMESLYSAAAAFKRTYYPADPFDGVLINASYLDIPDLVAVYKAAKVLQIEGNEAFTNTLILSKGATKTPMVRVNPLWVDANNQRKLEICELLHSFYQEPSSKFADKRQEIIEMQDAQLLKYLRQAEEALNLTAAELEVIVNAEV